MVHVKMTVGKPYIKTDAPPAADVSGIIGFSGDAAGAVAISFNNEVVKQNAGAANQAVAAGA